MNDQEKLDAIADLFDVEPTEITPETELETLEWDSMAMLGVIALAKTNGKSVAGATIREMETVADIMNVL